MSNLLYSDEGNDKEARMCCSLRTLTTGITGAMIMMVEAMVGKVVGVAISCQGTEKRGRWETHDNQLWLNNDNTTYKDDEHNDDAMYDNDVASGVAIGQMPAWQGNDPRKTMAETPAQQCQRNNGKDGSMILATMPAQQGGTQEHKKGNVAQFQFGVVGSWGGGNNAHALYFSTMVIFLWALSCTEMKGMCMWSLPLSPPSTCTTTT
jgi:hypothetical protein